MDADGTKAGFDLELIRRCGRWSRARSSPAAGRASWPLRARGRGGRDAVLAASVFHFGELRIAEVKDALRAAGQPVRRYREPYGRADDATLFCITACTIRARTLLSSG